MWSCNTCYHRHVRRFLKGWGDVCGAAESKAIDTDTPWGPKISTGDGQTITDADVDDDGEDLYNKVMMSMMGVMFLTILVNLQPMTFLFILFSNNESCVAIEFG
jgi:hypothetical protein